MWLVAACGTSGFACVDALAAALRSAGPLSRRFPEAYALLGRFPGDVRTGSALLGVTPPTFRRRVAALRSTKNGAGEG